MLPGEDGRDRRQSRVYAVDCRIERGVPAGRALLPVEVRECVYHFELRELLRFSAGEPDFPDSRGVLRLRWSVADTDGDSNGGTDSEHVLRLARADAIAFQVYDPEFVEDLAHLAAHTRKAGAAQI